MQVLGSIWKKKPEDIQTENDNKHRYVSLGNSRATNDKYNYSVEIIVRDSSGKVVASQKDGFLTIKDPRDVEGRTTDNLPSTLVAELLMSLTPR